MSVLSNIVDALRRIGSPTEKSALRRQDEQLKGHVVLERGRRTARLGDQTSSGFHAVVEPTEEEVSALDEGELAAISQNASQASNFLHAFEVDAEGETLFGLDKAFERWLNSSDRQGYSEQDVVEIVGASFGEYCSDALGMRWVRVADRRGVSVAIDGIESHFRAFPYDSVKKRIADGEHTFLQGIYVLLADQKERSKRRIDAGRNDE